MSQKNWKLRQRTHTHEHIKSINVNQIKLKFSWGQKNGTQTHKYASRCKVTLKEGKNCTSNDYLEIVCYNSEVEHLSSILEVSSSNADFGFCLFLNYLSLYLLS